MSARACFLVAVVAAPGCTSTGILDESDHTLQIGHAAVFHFHLETDGDEFQVTLGGSATNRSTEQDCRVAIYAFAAAPDPADLTPLPLGDAAPAEHAGGTLLADHDLPRQGAHSFAAAIDDLDLGGGRFTPPAHDRWIAAIPCPDADLTLDLRFVLSVYREGFRTPEYERPFVEQTW